MSTAEWQIIGFTVWIAALSTMVILPFGLGAAWLLARHDWPGKTLFETVITLPLVMPPIATGLILLTCFGNGGIGGFIHKHLG
ncbi:MAG: molybdate ABC transporter permease subunit, partial [Limisphaerales bacterium]